MKKITTFLLALLATAALFAQPYPDDSYELSEDKLTLKKWKGDETSVNMQADPVLKNVKHIDEKAFDYNKTITSITFPESLESIGNSAFEGCYALAGTLTIPNNVTSIGNYAFFRCKGFTEALTIGNSVKSIGNYAFLECGFTGALTIPNSVTSIEISAFYGCGGFTGDLTIPNSVTSIGTRAFAHCKGFKGSLTISNRLTSIEVHTFSNCTGFTGDLIIPNSVTSIGSGAFYDCGGFDGSLIIGNSVKNIVGYAFEHCSGLKAVKILATEPPAVADNNARLNTSLPLIVPEGSEQAYKEHEYWKNFASITGVAIPSSINKVEATTNELRFYPSPVKGLLTVDCEKAIEAYALYSGTGVLLQSKKTTEKQLQIDMSNYPSGIYFLRLLSQEEKTKTIKLIKK